MDNINFMTGNPSKLGEWIRENLDGRSQAWLAEKVGVEAPQISRIISGGKATAEMLVSIADALGKPRSQAFRAAGYTEKQTKEGEQVEEITHIYNELNNGNREDLLDYARLRLQKQDREKAGKRARTT